MDLNNIPADVRRKVLEDALAAVNTTRDPDALVGCGERFIHGFRSASAASVAAIQKLLIQTYPERTEAPL